MLKWLLTFKNFFFFFQKHSVCGGCVVTQPPNWMLQMPGISVTEMEAQHHYAHAETTTIVLSVPSTKERECPYSTKEKEQVVCKQWLTTILPRASSSQNKGMCDFNLLRALSCQHLTLCAVSANCRALFFSSSVFSSARPNLSPRSFKAWLAFCTALVTLSAAEWSMLFPAIAKETIRASKHIHALY